MTFQAGEAVWVELCTPDPEAAERFYTELLGWTVRHEKLGSTTYRMCSLGGRDVAGISDAAALHGGRRWDLGKGPGPMDHFATRGRPGR